MRPVAQPGSWVGRGSGGPPPARRAAAWLAAALAGAVPAAVPCAGPPGTAAAQPIDFSREVRPILAGNCFICHGPDAAQRKAGLRLDTRDGALADLGMGLRAVVPGDLLKSELLRRVSSSDPADRMPPPQTGKRLGADQVEVLRRWIAEGAPYARHWSYVPPARPKLPPVRDASWCRNEIDRFILARLEREGIAPSPEADRHALARRLFLDLTGLPPTVEEVDEFVADPGPDAYERFVDRILAKPAYGEHWARMWLDLSRYADSAGYADDPPRTIWAYRDWVIRAFNEDKPFDEFTIEQIAGDLLPRPTEEQLIATAFHRNTQTNNEGGTNDEEFRNVAVVDRVNTTFAAWMGTTLACAQCHAHKYDPFTQEEYYRIFAFFNDTQDADRTDETPILPLYTEEDRQRKAKLEQEAVRLEQALKTRTPELAASQERWEAALREEISWRPLRPETAEARSGTALEVLDDGSVRAADGRATDVYRLVCPLEGGAIAGIRLEALADPSLPGGGPGHAAGNFVLTRLEAAIRTPGASPPAGRYVRVDLPGDERILSLAEVEVYSGSGNAARRGTAGQHSTAHGGAAGRAIDGNTDGRYTEAMSTTHTDAARDPWWEVDLGSVVPVDRIVIWNRVDAGLHVRLGGFRASILDGERRTVWERTVSDPPNPSIALLPAGPRDLPLASAHADHWQPGFEPEHSLGKGPRGKDPPAKGWAIGGAAGRTHAITYIPAAAEETAPGAKLEISAEQTSKHERHTIGRLRISVTGDRRVAERARVPASLLAVLKTPAASRTAAQADELEAFYLSTIAPELEPARRELALVRKELSGIKPYTTVPILRELDPGQRRKTHVHIRGNFLDHGKEVGRGVPSVFHPLPADAPPDRLALARWLVDPQNPLTARVIANRYWEKIFGIGIVVTSEDFGLQGEPPAHPELLDWLAVELVEGGWKLKAFLRRIVSSAAYRQSSRVSPGALERDPENRLLGRGARFRLAAEEIRDQALFAAGLLSSKMYGPPVRPPQPSLGLNAAFGGGIDWQTSEGEDRYRRALYTTWRRSSPYPSMATFDAPNREVCAIRRARTNTPLQALVTLNDPVYIEAAQGLARRMIRAGGSPAEKATRGFRLVLARPPREDELARVLRLHEDARERLRESPDGALRLATAPLGPLPEGADPVELAAWTVVGNVILNLDEALMKR